MGVSDNDYDLNHPPSPVILCPLLKISLGNPYLKILNLSKLLNAPSKKNIIRPLLKLRQR